MNKTFANPGRLKPWLGWGITREFGNGELNLNSKELKLLEESRQHVKEVMSVLDNL